MQKTSSPYLKELFKGEIKWMPFNLKSLKYAQQTDRIIYIHIGYIANIEEREKAYRIFKDERVINIINNNFVPIAIDMEDVPEAMLIGMDLLVISEQRYTIPINIFSLPGAKPFISFSNTTPEEFINLSNNIIYSFREKRELLNKAGKYMSTRLKGTGIVTKKEKSYPITDKLLHAYVRSWMTRYVANRQRDRKSPYSINSRYYVFLLKYANHYGKQEEMDFLDKAVDKVYYSAIFDPIDGGLFSQSTNASFTEPLYEKQFSENIQAAVLYSFAYKYYKKAIYKEAAIRIINFIEENLKSNKGGYITSLSLSCSVKDSTYYKYSLSELKKAFPENYTTIANALGMNCNEESSYQQIISNTANYKELSQEIKGKLKSIRQQKNSETIKDNRVITAYNCMYATSLCIIANNIKEKKNEYIAQAEKIIEHIQNNQKDGNIKLYRYISSNKSEHQNAQLLDYTFFLNALLNIHKHTHNSAYDKLISKYTAYILLNYYQAHNGMFCKTPKAEAITPFKRESIIDYVRYSANSVMARNLWILYKMRKDEFYLEAFKQQLYNIAPQMIGTGPLMVGWALQILNYLSNKSDYD